MRQVGQKFLDTIDVNHVLEGPFTSSPRSSEQQQTSSVAAAQQQLKRWRLVAMQLIATEPPLTGPGVQQRQGWPLAELSKLPEKKGSLLVEMSK